ncbi:single-stranded DNA-binding protein [Spiroplasma endosymbiont of Amphibalanus improvisus]|uniref:single-stranded DNA-binding protein n=1 Tax=Spiroplasma endosymbiont of Amphibalanus improvisus TaxID=3066327 RepID=UPI00313D75B9
MLNRVLLVGRLTADPILRTSKNQKVFCAFTLAVQNIFNDTANFVPCFAWNKTAEIMAKNLNKGALISLDGRLNTRTTNDNGNMMTIVEVTAESISFLEPKRNKSDISSNGLSNNFYGNNNIPNPNNLEFKPDSISNDQTGENQNNKINNDSDNNKDKIEDAILWD